MPNKKKIVKSSYHNQCYNDGSTLNGNGVFMNIVNLQGIVSTEPKLITLPDGSKQLQASLPTSEKWNDPITGPRENTEWHTVVFNSDIHQQVAREIKKGSEILVKGKIHYRHETTNDNKSIYYTEILCHEYELKNQPPVTNLMNNQIDDFPY